MARNHGNISTLNLSRAFIVFAIIMTSFFSTNKQSAEAKTMRRSDGSSPDNDPVKVSVYYESRCPDSSAFITDQLEPTMKLLGEKAINVDLVPFGKAAVDSDKKMTCQHGEPECADNRLFACIQAKAKTQLEAVEKTSCIFKKGVQRRETCFDNSTPHLVWQDLLKCSKSMESLEMMIVNEKKTGDVSYVPKVVVGDPKNYNERAQNLAEFSLKEYVCSELKSKYSKYIPEACKSS